MEAITARIKGGLGLGAGDGVSQQRRKTRNTLKRQDKIWRRLVAYACENAPNIQALCRRLMEDDVLTFEETAEIESKSTDQKKMFEIMRLLQRKGLEALELFKKALKAMGSAHIQERIVELEGNVSEDEEEQKEDSKERRRRHKRKESKKGKLFSVYVASDGEGDSEYETEEENFDKDDDENPSLDLLWRYFRFLEWYLRNIDFFPQKLYTVHRFDWAPPTEMAQMGERFQHSFQTFRVNRAVYLEKVGFYGPGKSAVASYEVTVKLTFWSSGRPVTTIAEIAEVVEVKKGSIMYLEFGKVQPIRPHIWHAIHFSIRGQESMLVQKPSKKVRNASVQYEVDAEDAVRFEFETSSCFSTCQLPELLFYRGKSRISAPKFPLPPKKIVTEHRRLLCCFASATSSPVEQ